MKVVYGSKDNYISPKGVACALGFFDGVHSGHQSLVSILKQVSEEHNLESMIFTFDRHPMALIDSKREPKLITDNITKTSIFNKLGIDILYYCHVDRNFLTTDPQSFLNDILYNSLNVRAIVAGFNFTFGYKGEGNADVLLKFGKDKNIDVRIVNPVYIDNTLVSSTKIRELLKYGDIKKANMMLKRKFVMHGKIVHGKQRGREIGFPTANIIPDSSLIVPKNGVYITKVYIGDETRIGITNIGYNPTFSNDAMSIETHIIDFYEDIYGREMVLEFYDRIRDEKKYSKISELISQLNKDKQYAIRFFEFEN